MKKLLTAFALVFTVLAGSTSAMAAHGSTVYEELPEWAEQAFAPTT